MKKLKLLIIGLVGLVITDNASAQLNFTVNPGVQYNGANFGYKIGNFLPYMGLQYYGGSSKLAYSGTEWNNMTSQMESYSNEFEFKAKMFLPTIGTKFYFLNMGDLKAFGNLNVTKPIITASFKEDGVENPDVTEFIEKISLWAGDIGVGAEYSFAPQFSISGEFGLRWFRIKYEDSFDQEVFNPMTGMSETHEASILSTSFLSPTYSRISLNFYFTGSKMNKNKKEGNPEE
ncbi:MAG: hypothetical protein WDZ35_04820 [Crocinitomicaceae bacterium]